MESTPAAQTLVDEADGPRSSARLPACGAAPEWENCSRCTRNDWYVTSSHPGNTPLVRINSLSELTGCEILGKAEFVNPGGSPKDRVALEIITEAEERGELVPNVGSWIFEGTVGSTGISIATLARAKGYNCCIVRIQTYADCSR